MTLCFNSSEKSMYQELVPKALLYPISVVQEAKKKRLKSVKRFYVNKLLNINDDKNIFYPSSLYPLNNVTSYGWRQSDKLNFKFEILNKIKKNKKLTKLGVSVYTKKELDWIIKNFDIDLVNVPLSIANDEFNQKNYLRKLKKRGIEIHVRSIFLQGLLLSEYEDLPKKFKSNKFFIDWFKWLNRNNYNKLDVSLSYVKNIKNIDKIIVSVYSLNQLKNIIISYRKRLKLELLKFNQQKILRNPSKW